MQLTKIKKIIVFGGGTSGWLTAAYLTKNLRVPTKIVLIEDAAAGPIGVGEGTQPFTTKFLAECGIYAKDWMKPSNAAFKWGVELIGWNDRPYFVDNDHKNNGGIAEDLYTSDYFIDKDYSEFAAWHPAYRLAKKNICQKLDGHLDVNHHMGKEDFGAVHFSAYDIINTIKTLIFDKIDYIDKKIVEVKQGDQGISGLLSADGDLFTADMYIDCSGFQSVLIEKTLGSKFISFNNWLLNDRAVAMPTEYKDPIIECHPYTKATTMTAGWRWTIPIFSRIGNGYVYSSKFITPEEAEQELRQVLNEPDRPVKHLAMKCGTRNNIALKNVCAVGLSAGFVEPLEATGITFTTAVVKSISDLLNLSGNVWGNTQRELLNSGFQEMSSEILAFVWSHYYFSSRNDTPYWKEIRNQKIEMMPDGVKKILSLFLPRPKRFFVITQSSMFNVVQWFSMLKAGGAYDHIDNSGLSDKQTKYVEYFLESEKKRLELAENIFPNHYEYLKEWYSK